MAAYDDLVEEDARPVPMHIDKSDRMGEVLMVFAFVIFVGRIPVTLLSADPATGNSFYLIPAGILAGYVYHKLTVDQKPGFALHLAYRLGARVDGLLPRSVKRLVK